MLRTIEATIAEDGTIRLSEPVTLTGSRRALVTILDEPMTDEEARHEAEMNAWARAGAKSLAEAFPDDDFSDWEKQP